MNRKIVVIGIVSAVFGMIVALYIIPWFSSVASKWGNNELMAVITLAGVLIALSTPYIDHRLSIKRENLCKSTVYLIDIDVKMLNNNNVLFSASIQNVGDNQIRTSTANLYIDQGEKHRLVNDRDSSDVGVVFYKFPFILEHRESINGRPDCVLCKKCFREHNPEYPEEAVEQSLKDKKTMFRAHYELRHLSKASIMYINPKEKFSEDVIVQFKNEGVYRVTLFVGAEDTADCCCATKQFYIPKSLPYSSNEQVDTENLYTK